MPKVDILKWSTDQHSKYFKIHSENGHPIQDRQNSVSRSPSSFIVRRVRSSVALKEIKSIPKIHDLLKNHKCYLIEHRWTKNVWDTVQLGFFQGTNPQSSADNATTMISNEIKIFFLRQRSQSSRLLSAPHKQKFRTPSFGLKHMQLKLRNLHKSWPWRTHPPVSPKMGGQSSKKHPSRWWFWCDIPRLRWSWEEGL